MPHKGRSGKSVYKLCYTRDICSHNNNSISLFRVSPPFNTIVRTKLDLTICNLDTNLCNIYEVSNSFKFIDGSLAQIGTNEILFFEETTPITITYDTFYNKILINVSNPGGHIRYIGKLSLLIFQL